MNQPETLKLEQWHITALHNAISDLNGKASRNEFTSPSYAAGVTKEANFLQEVDSILRSQQARIESLEKALVYSANMQHSTPLNMLPPGVTLMSDGLGDSVEVRLGDQRILAGPIDMKEFWPAAELTKALSAKLGGAESDALNECLSAMDRARNILTKGNPTKDCNWGMLDTSCIRDRLVNLPPSAARTDHHDWIRNALNLPTDAPYRFDYYAECIDKLKTPSAVRYPLSDAIKHEPNEKILALANRIDSEQLWRLPGMTQLDMPPDKKDKLAAGVNLRRYADLLGSGSWRIFPPKSGMSFRANTFEKVVEMVRDHLTKYPDDLDQSDGIKPAQGEK